MFALYPVQCNEIDRHLIGDNFHRQDVIQFRIRQLIARKTVGVLSAPRAMRIDSEEDT